MTRKKAVPTPAPTPSKDERDKIVVVDTSCLAPYFASTSLEHHMTRGRPTSSSDALMSHHLYNVDMHTSQGPNVVGGGGNRIAHTSLEQHKLWSHALHQPQPVYSPVTPVSHHLCGIAMHTSQGPNIGGDGGNGIAAQDAHVPLQWGHRKRSRSRREAHALTPEPEPELTPAEAQAEGVKLMLPSSARDPNLITDPSLPPRAVTLSLRRYARPSASQYCPYSSSLLACFVAVLYWFVSHAVLSFFIYNVNQLNFFGLIEHIKHVLFPC